MAYYQGDYYQGDYYQGDPFLGGLIGMGVGWLAKKIFKRKLSDVAMQRAGSKIVQAGYRGAGRAAPLVIGAAVGSGLSLPLPGGIRMQPGAFLPGGAPLFTREPRVTMTGQIGGAECCPSGYHLTKDGSGRCVRNRSMNVANPRALRRSLRRVAGFGKLAARAKKDIKRAAKSIGA